VAQEEAGAPGSFAIMVRCPEATAAKLLCAAMVWRPEQRGSPRVRRKMSGAKYEKKIAYDVLAALLGRKKFSVFSLKRVDRWGGQVV
jgi:hypothetical protein